MKTYSGPAVLILDDGTHVELTAELTLDTEELARQSLDWNGKLIGTRNSDARLAHMFDVRLHVPNVEFDTVCYVEELHITGTNMTIKIRDHDPKNPLSSRLPANKTTERNADVAR
jgi:hypothetical protein